MEEREKGGWFLGKAGHRRLDGMGILGSFVFEWLVWLVAWVVEEFWF